MIAKILSIRILDQPWTGTTSGRPVERGVPTQIDQLIGLLDINQRS
jgi:hypothetical protein